MPHCAHDTCSRRRATGSVTSTVREAGGARMACGPKRELAYASRTAQRSDTALSPQRPVAHTTRIEGHPLCTHYNKSATKMALLVNRTVHSRATTATYMYVRTYSTLTATEGVHHVRETVNTAADTVHVPQNYEYAVSTCKPSQLGATTQAANRPLSNSSPPRGKRQCITLTVLLPHNIPQKASAQRSI
jgi:hypothetical protein